MKTLREYLERNQYSIVKSLGELLSISDEEAKNFYDSLSTFDESTVIQALKDGAEPDLVDNVKDMFAKFRSTEIEEDLSPEEIDPNFDDVNDRFEIRHNGKKYEIFDHKTGEVVDDAWSGHEAHNLLYSWRQQAKRKMGETINFGPEDLEKVARDREEHDKLKGFGQPIDDEDDEDIEEATKPKDREISQMAGKAMAGGYDMAKELSKGQYQPKVIQNKKFKNDRQADKSKLKRGMYESTITPVLFSDNDQLKFKIVESNTVAEMSNVKAIFESTVMISPMGGLSSVPGVGMSGLRKMAGIAEPEAPMAGENLQDLDCGDFEVELESNDVNQVLAMISQMDDASKAALINLMTGAVEEPSMSAEQIETVKCAVRDFGAALQCWIEESCGALDFLCPLVDALWVKYNEFEV